MHSKKGMSQTLALIVAASVLMMTALTMIFMMRGSLGGVGEDTQTDSCIATIQAKCDATFNEEVSTPSICTNNDGDLAVSLPSGYSGNGDTITCPS